ncbi:MAG: hypothetical protein ABFD97_19130, partial [Syntrophobacter sp.]
SPDTIVQAPGDPQTLNRYAYCRNNPLIYTDPTGHFFIFDDLIEIGILIGAALGATISAIYGGNIALGALTGAISGAFFAGAGIIGAGLDSVVQAGIHTAAGAMSGAINAGITGGNVLQSAVTSGLSAGVAKYAMAGILPNTSLYKEVGDLAGKWGQVGMQGATAIATGTVMGGFSSMLMAGSFGAGAAQGAWTSAYGFFFNGAAHEMARIMNPEGGKESFFDNQTEGSVTDAAKTGLFLLGGFTASAGALVAGEALVAYGGALSLDAYAYIMSAAGTPAAQWVLQNGNNLFLSYFRTAPPPPSQFPGLTYWLWYLGHQ